MYGASHMSILSWSTSAGDGWIKEPREVTPPVAVWTIFRIREPATEGRGELTITLVVTEKVTHTTDAFPLNTSPVVIWENVSWALRGVQIPLVNFLSIFIHLWSKCLRGSSKKNCSPWKITPLKTSHFKILLPKKLGVTNWPPFKKLTPPKNWFPSKSSIWVYVLLHNILQLCSVRLLAFFWNANWHFLKS